MTNSNGTNVTNGTYTFVFKLYTVSSGGVAVWTETDSLVVTDGIFQVNLGAVTTLPGSVNFNSDNIYLGITFNSDPAGEMTPRVQLTASPYAFNADQLDGLDSSALVQLSPSGQQTGGINISGGATVAGGADITGAAVNLNASSNFATNINTGTSTGAISLGNAAAGAITLKSGANITVGTSDTTGTLLVLDTKTGSGDPTGVDGGVYYNSNAAKFRCYQNGAWTDCISTGGGITTIGSIDTTPTAANGARISGSSIFMQYGDGTYPGLVSTTTQTFAGNKTFSGTVTVTGLTTLNGGLTVEAGDTFTMNGDAFTDLTGTGLAISSGALQLSYANTLASNSMGADNTTFASTGLLFEGTTSNSSEILLTPVDPTADRTITLPDATGTVVLDSTLTTEGDIYYRNGTQLARLARGSNNDCLTSSTTTILWASCPGGVTSIGSVDTTPTAANGARISGSSLILQYGDGTYPGLVSTTTQTFAGNKTFSGTITVANITPSANLTIGTSNTTGTLLVLDDKTDSGDPTGVNGGMYYNSNAGKFRCYQASAWTDCVGGTALFTDGGTETYLTSTTDDFMVGGSSVAASSLFADVSAGSLKVGNASLAGSYIMSDGSSSSITFKSATQVAATNYDITVPAITANDTMCLATLSNCVSNVMATFQASVVNQAQNTTTALNFLMPTAATTVAYNLAGTTEFKTDKAGSFRSCSVVNSAAVTAGSVSVRFRKNGANTSSTNYCTLNTTNTRTNSSTISSNVETFAAGDTIGVALVSDGTYAPATLEETVTFIVEYHNTGGGGSISGDILNGGNTTGAAVTIGTNDSNGLNLEANNTTVASFSSTGAANFQNSADSSTAFRIQRASAGGTLFTVDSTTTSGSRNGIITVGASDTTATLLVLDDKTGSGDPTGVNGGMYYNSNSSKFRCYQASAWTDCIGSGGSTLFTDAGTQTYLTSTTDELVVGSSSSLSAKLAVVNTSDQEAFLIRAYSSQTDDNPLMLFQSSAGTEIGRLSFDSSANSFLGYQAGGTAQSGANDNLGIGYSSLETLTSGDGNVAVGKQSLQNNATGTNNIAMGLLAMYNSEGGTHNIGLGYQSLSANTGNYNVGVGYQTLMTNTTGSGNVALGSQALTTNSTGTGNIALGSSSLYAATGDYNVGIGYLSLVDNTSGGYSVGLGYNALGGNATGGSNVGIGRESMRDSEGGQYNVGIGTQVLFNNTGDYNVALGNSALLSNTSGSHSIALGYQALYSNTTSWSNVALGWEALKHNTTGTENIALGGGSLDDNTTGNDSVAIGDEALRNNASGDHNIAFGDDAMRDSEGGSHNIAVGYQSLLNSTGNNNIALGNAAGDNLTAGSSNIIIGAGLDFDSTTGSNQLNLGGVLKGNTSTLAATFQGTLAFTTMGTASGNHLCYDGTNRLATCTSSRTKKHDIADSTYGLDQVRQLQSVTFAWNEGNREDVGFIAEDVAQIIPETTQFDANGNVTAFNYDPLVSVLTRGVQQLDVQVQANDSRLTVLESKVTQTISQDQGWATSAWVLQLVNSVQNRVALLEHGTLPQLNVAGSANIAGNLSVAGTTTVNNITIAGKIITTGATPTATIELPYIATDASVTVTGNDTAGELKLDYTAAATAVTGKQVSVTFSTAFSAKPRVNLTPTTSAAAAIRYYTEQTPQGFTIFFIDKPTPGKSYGFNFFAVQ